jgi:chromosome segregation ATPase
MLGVRKLTAQVEALTTETETLRNALNIENGRSRTAEEALAAAQETIAELRHDLDGLQSGQAQLAAEVSQLRGTLEKLFLLEGRYTKLDRQCEQLALDLQGAVTGLTARIDQATGRVGRR